MVVPNPDLTHLPFPGMHDSGWQKQPGRKAVEGMRLNTLRVVLPGRKCKILWAGCTDTRPSALQATSECSLENEPLTDREGFS